MDNDQPTLDEYLESLGGNQRIIAELKAENERLNIKMQQFLSNEQEYSAELKQLHADKAELIEQIRTIQNYVDSTSETDAGAYQKYDEEITLFLQKHQDKP